MPDGIHHNNVWKAGWLVIAPCSFYSMVFSFDLGVSIAVGYALGRYINPDADGMGVSHAEGLLVNEVPVIGHLIFGWMSTYGAITRRLHRKWITHLPVVSTFTRLVWMLWWVGILYYFDILQFQMWDAIMFLGVLVGLSSSDAMHFMSDLWFTKKKER